MEKYPLHWPTGWPRTNSRKQSPFKKLSSYAASDLLMQEVRRLLGKSSVDLKNVVLSTNVELRQDGLPYASQRKLTDPGASLYFRYKKKDLVMACDTFDQLGCNIHAMVKTIEAMRGIDRWGCSELMNRAFTGFQALPERASQPTWYSILGLPETANAFAIKDRYRELSQLYHPDKPETGNSEKFIQVKNAYEEGMKSFS